MKLKIKILEVNHDELTIVNETKDKITLPEAKDGHTILLNILGKNYKLHNNELIKISS